MRRVRYQVATSADGYIAGPRDEADWIVMDPDIDFGALFAQFDTMLIGRRTFEAALAMGGMTSMAGMRTYVFSSTLPPARHPDVTVVAEKAAETVAALKQTPGKDIWLMGGGLLFRSLLDAGLVDTVELAIVPVLLGGGVPFLPPRDGRVPLALTGTKTYDKSGIVLIEYRVNR